MVERLPKYMQKLLALFKGKSVSKYLIATILVIVPLYPKFPFINIPGTYVAIRFEDLLLLLLGCITFIKILGNLKVYLKDDLFRAFLLFFVVGLVSLISAIFITQTVSLHIGLLHLLRRVEYSVPFFAVLTLFNSKDIPSTLNYYIGLLTIVVSVLFIYGVGQRYFSFPIIITQNQEYSKGIALRYTDGSHINSTFAGHYDMASYMVLILPVIISLLFILKEKYSKVILFVVAVLGMWLLVNSLSRIAQISYLVSVSLSMILLKKYRELLAVIVISLVFILSSNGLYQRFSRFFNVYAADEISIPVDKPIEVYEDRSTNIRLAVEWPRALRALSKNPLLGTGYSSIGLATDNDYLRVLGETGILGFFSFGLIFINLFKEFKKYKFGLNLSGLNKGLVIGIIGGIVGTLITACFIDIFEASKFAITFWLFVGLSVFTLRNSINVQKN